jgi:hypothetical protein
MDNIYLGLTREFNAGRLRAIISSGQAVVLYRAAAEAWSAVWPELAREATGLPLPDAHRLIVRRAEGVLPCAVPGGMASD